MAGSPSVTKSLRERSLGTRRYLRFDRARKMMDPSFMSWLLVVQPDSVQADVLREALLAHTSEDVVVANSLDDALSAIDLDIPDIVLLPPLIPAAVEEYVIGYLGTIPGARHVRILGIPVLEHSDDAAQRRTRSLIPWRRPQEPLTPGCDPGMFTQVVLNYVSGARALKHELTLRRAQAALSRSSDRRTEPRFSRHKVPWLSVTRFGLGRAALINVSSRGVLLRTQNRPEDHFLKRSDPTRERSRLTFELGPGDEIHTMARVIRCVPLKTGAGVQYEIAFSFDNAVGLHLPGTLVTKSSATKNDGV